MPLFSGRPTPSFPNVDLLTYLFNDPRTPYPHDLNTPLFISSSNTSNFLTGNSIENLLRRLGKGLRDLAGIRDHGGNDAGKDVVLCTSTNHLLYPICMLGTICAGAIFSGANPGYGESELTHQLRDSGAKVIFASAGTLPTVLLCTEKLGIPKSQIFLFDGPRDGIRGIESLFDNDGMEWRRISTYEEMANSTAVLLYSSGTTGLSKGCRITHQNLVCGGISCLQCSDPTDGRIRPKKTYLAFLPLYHILGQLYYCVGSVKTGNTTYIMEDFTFPGLLASIEKFRINFLVIVPPIAVLIAKSPVTKKYDLSSVQYVLSGGAPLSAEAGLGVERVFDPTGKKDARITQVWGLSETTGAATFFDLDDYDDEGKREGVGKLISGVSAMIISDDGKEVAQGERGEILVRGPTIFPGYWRNEKATKETFTRDGWLKTGDIGYMTKKDVLFIVDRKKELIKVKGFQVAPAELEATLLESHDVDDVAVIGIKIDDAEHPRAYIVPAHPNVKAEDVQKWVSNRLAPYKRLTGGVRFVKSIPKSASGKILRKDLKAEAARESSAPAIAKL
ncbi:acetyl-CoA synthetase-like protein [Sistotremastrum suecicum HHB10207 ss-3]|uniref:Acetyl-CoA synthetase-like protein n=1 Tax=Sistotremastrum suecicum HHB10207 ss-3 TaxID=1314776 RepID=A0A166GGQ8_9AGAM|nr:acetyl-CoA synthetase-like protein [Sistotremastrum suecicum HHB10207 ss-3]